MKIGDLAKAADVSKDTIRHYVDVGLIEAHRNPANGYQLFDQQALQRLRFIKAAQSLGLRLPDIQLIFDDAGQARSPCPRVRDLIIERIDDTRGRIRELTRLCERMETAVRQWESMPDSAPDGRSICELIESQQGGQKP